MKVQFYANAVFLYEEDEVMITSFVDNVDTPTEVLTFQYALFEDEGQPVYCERNDQAQASYNGIKKAILTRTSLWIMFNEEVVKKMICNELVVSFQIDDTLFEELTDRLTLIFNESSILQVK